VFIWNLNTYEISLYYPWFQFPNPRKLDWRYLIGRYRLVAAIRVWKVYFIEWKICGEIPLNVDRGISVGTLYAGELHTYRVFTTAKLEADIVRSDKVTANSKMTSFPWVSTVHDWDRRVWVWLAAIRRRASDSLRMYTLRIGS